MVITVLDSLYHDDSGSTYPPPPREECATNCALTVRANRKCQTSVLLLEQVRQEEARNSLRSLRIGRDDLCAIELECCNLSRVILQQTCSIQCKRKRDLRDRGS